MDTQEIYLKRLHAALRTPNGLAQDISSIYGGVEKVADSVDVSLLDSLADILEKVENQIRDYYNVDYKAFNDAFDDSFG